MKLKEVIASLTEDMMEWEVRLQMPSTQGNFTQGGTIRKVVPHMQKSRNANGEFVIDDKLSFIEVTTSPVYLGANG